MDERGLTSSVLMATYNGMKFLIPQLDSIRLQTVPADEVVICDDGSTDETVETIKAYIEKYNLVSWHVSKNSENKGWMLNFMDMAINCHTDLVFFSDQDDIWSHKKIEQMKNTMSENPNIDLLYSNYKLIENISASDERGEWKVNAKPKIRHNSDIFKYSMVRMGCAFCLRKTFIDEIKGLYWEGCPHDSFFYRAALVKGSLYNLNSILIYHRIHGNNASAMTLAEQKSADMLTYKLGSVHHMIEYANLIGNTNAVGILNKALEWNEKRIVFYEKPTIKKYLRLLKYFKYYFRFRTFLKELFIAYANKDGGINETAS